MLEVSQFDKFIPKWNYSPAGIEGSYNGKFFLYTYTMIGSELAIDTS